LGIWKNSNSNIINFSSGSNLSPQAYIGISFLGCSISNVSSWA